MKKKIRVGIVFGGKSAEHEVSIQSAKNVYEAIDKKKYEVVLIGITKKGKWILKDPREVRHLAGKHKELPEQQSRGLIPFTLFDAHRKIDVIFPILHGPYGEDGTIQGLLKLAGIPFVGSGVLGSAVGMDKDVMKRLLREAGIPVPRFLVFHKGEKISFSKIKKHLGLPFFLKPANLGSSVGVHKVKDEKQFRKATEDAFQYDLKILIEEYVRGREIECAVLGNEHPRASLPGEIIPQHEFYSYEAKYLDANGALLKVPAELPKSTIEEIQSLAVQAFEVLSAEGMARVDFFLKPSGKAVINEINTIPGFTKISMYPKMWEASGISYTELIDRLIRLALERFQKEKELKVSYP